MTVQVSAAERIAWDYLDDGNYYGGNTLREWAVGVVEAVEEFVENGGDEDRLCEVYDGAVPVYTGDKMALVSDSTTLCSMEPELEPERKTPEGYCDAVLYDLASGLTYAAYNTLTEDES